MLASTAIAWKGSYRLICPRHSRTRGLSRTTVPFIEADSVEDGLRAFSREVAEDSDDCGSRLPAEGLLCTLELNLDKIIPHHFPDFTT